MNIIGIDFSILYPGICISNDFKDFKWIGIANNKITKKDTKLMEEISLTYPNLKLHCLGERAKKENQYHINERNKLENYIKLTDYIIDKIKEHTKNKFFAYISSFA